MGTSEVAERGKQVVVAARVQSLVRGACPSGATPLPRAVEISEGRIVRLLSEDTLRAVDRRHILDLGAATLLPGLADAHLHLFGLGRALAQLDLRGLTSPPAIATRVHEAAQDLSPGEWIRGRGWDHLRFSLPVWPDRSVLDEVAPAHPVWLARVDGHAAWLNTRALDRAGITASTPDPPGGRILRDRAGAPTGVIIDNALALAGRALPAHDAVEIDRNLAMAVEHCRSFGLTSVHDMGTRAATLERLEKLARAGALALRVIAYLEWEEARMAGAFCRGPFSLGKLAVVGVKLYCDGALGSHGAAMETPYLDRPEHRGLLLTEPGVLRDRALRAARTGFDVAIHGIGDRGCRLALDAFEAVRHEGHCVVLRLEHAQILAPGDLSRLARLKVVASLQPTHATSDMSWVEARLGSDRLACAYAPRTLLDHGVTLALGSDAPIESANPWWGVHAAVTRQDREGRPEGGWRPAQRLGLGEALWGFTRGAGIAAGFGGRDGLGLLRPGAPADLCATAQDPRAISPGELHRVQAVWSALGR